MRGVACAACGAPASDCDPPARGDSFCGAGVCVSEAVGRGASGAVDCGSWARVVSDCGAESADVVFGVGVDAPLAVCEDVCVGGCATSFADAESACALG